MERARLLPDPATALADANDRRDQAAQRQSHLRGISERYATETGRGNDAKRHSEELAACASAANDALAPGLVDELAGLVSKAGHIAEQRGHVQSDRASRQVDVDSLGKALKTADEAGEGLEDLAAALSTVASVREQLLPLVADIEAARKETKDIEALRNAVSIEEDRVDDLQQKAQTASAESQHAWSKRRGQPTKGSNRRGRCCTPLGRSLTRFRADKTKPAWRQNESSKRKQTWRRLLGSPRSRPSGF